MKREIKNVLLLGGMMLTTAVGFSQTVVKQGDKAYEKWDYSKSIERYEQALSKRYAGKELYARLADSYYFNAKYREAQEYYGRLFAQYGSEDIEPIYYYRYAQSLHSVGKEEEAKRYYEEFTTKLPTAEISKLRREETKYLGQIRENSGRYRALENMDFNTKYADYGTFVHEGELYFSSSRKQRGITREIHGWTGHSMTDLYKVSVENLKEVERVKLGVKSRLNESTLVITKDGNTIYFTRNNIQNGKRGFDTDKNTNLKIYRIQKKDGKWSEVEELPFNSDSFNTAHPSLSADEKTLYFSSDRPGGYGQSDLWKVRIEEGGFTDPENLGSSINTEGRETFPYVTKEDELYFASDGRVGFGGLDIYGTKLVRGNFVEVQNLGSPINSEYDDFGYYIEGTSKKGYLTSNRENGKGDDDIYSFIEERSLVFECNQKLLVVVLDKKTKEEIKGATLTLFDSTKKAEEVAVSYSQGKYEFDKEVGCKEVYYVKATQLGYHPSEVIAEIPGERGETQVVLELDPIRPIQTAIQFKKGDDLFKVLELNPIYFDLNKHNIRPDAALELSKVLAVMKEYPSMKVDIRSHTDSRASHKYNDKLSGNRAKSTAEWLISQGIERERLTWKGYGERQLQNECSDNVPCSEEKHQQNRRSEFIIVEL